MDLSILCERVDWQVSRQAQVLNQISALLSNMTHFAIVSHSISPIPLTPDDMDNIEYLELLRPFSSAQTLFVPKEVARHVSRSLENTAVVTATDASLALDMLCSEAQPISSIRKFIDARSESGRPVSTADNRWNFERKLSYR